MFGVMSVLVGLSIADFCKSPALKEEESLYSEKEEDNVELCKVEIEQVPQTKAALEQRHKIAKFASL